MTKNSELLKNGVATGRCVLDDGTWFDGDQVVLYDQGMIDEGGHDVSVATGSIFANQTLIQTRKGNWIIAHEFTKADEQDFYELVDEETAVRWLLINDVPLPDGVDLNDTMAKLEI